jgi:hypothetical protein
MEEIVKYALIIIFVTAFAPGITVLIVKCFKKIFPTNNKTINELVGLSRDKSLIKKLEKYSTAATLIICLLWPAIIFYGILNANSLMELSFPMWLKIVFLFAYLISSMGPAAYVSWIIVLIIFKLFNPRLRGSLFWNYYPGALKPGSPVNLLEYNKKYGVNYTKLNGYITKIFTIIFIALLLVVIYSNLTV